MILLIFLILHPDALVIFNFVLQRMNLGLCLESAFFISGAIWKSAILCCCELIFDIIFKLLQTVLQCRRVQYKCCNLCKMVELKPEML